MWGCMKRHQRVEKGLGSLFSYRHVKLAYKQPLFRTGFWHFSSHFNKSTLRSGQMLYHLMKK